MHNRLIVFADDWGRHPSSCQHLVRHLLGHWEALWVDTIGMRRPTLGRGDLGKIAGRLKRWIRPDTSDRLPAHLTVIAPRMYPGFRTDWQRRFNARRLAAAVKRHLQPGEKPVGLTTLPITADLPDLLPGVGRWVYYCVDDFSVWPGLDGQAMDQMERQLVSRVDALAAVSPTLQQRLASMGRDSTLITHGIDPEHWQRRQARPFHGPGPGSGSGSPPWWKNLTPPVLLFWGVVDQRLDADACLALADRAGTLVLVGPAQSPDARLPSHPKIKLPGAVGYDELPGVAALADALVMPYADLPVTRAMQPLKLKEYLATGKPAIVRDLPATRPWSDAADLADSTEAFVTVTLKRLREGVPEAQRAARRRLEHETWAVKAQQLASLLAG